MQEYVFASKQILLGKSGIVIWPDTLPVSFLLPFPVEHTINNYTLKPWWVKYVVKLKTEEKVGQLYIGGDYLRQACPVSIAENNWTRATKPDIAKIFPELPPFDSYIYIEELRYHLIHSSQWCFSLKLPFLFNLIKSRADMNSKSKVCGSFVNRENVVTS